jgi:hypothetical protein
MKKAITTAITDSWAQPLAVLLHSLRTRAGWGPDEFDVYVYQLDEMKASSYATICAAWGALPALRSLSSVTRHEYLVSQQDPIWSTFTAKIDLLGAELADRVIWLDADMLAVGELPMLRDALDDAGTIWTGADVGPGGQNYNGARPAMSTGVIVYSPDRGLPSRIARYSHEHRRTYLYGDQQLVSWYVNEVIPSARREIPHSHHLNTRYATWHPALYAAERPGARLLHWGGPKPWGQGRADCVEADLWEAELRSCPLPA